MSFTDAKILGFDVRYADYKTKVPRGNRDFVMSNGELREFVNCPAKWLAGSAEDEDTDATIWGNAIDVLGPHPERFDELYAVAPAEYPDRKTGEPKPWNWNATFCQEWRDAQGEKTVIKHELQGKIIGALKALRESAVQSLFDCSKTQAHVLGHWQDKATGLVIPVQCLIDLVPDKNHATWSKSLGNFKTARNGDPNMFARVIDDLGYDVGGALETDLYIAATGEDRTDYLIPTQENTAPYHVTFPIMALTSEFIAYGKAKVETAMREYAQCLATNHWPSYSTSGRLVIGPVQLVGPESLFKYREAGGTIASRQDYQRSPRPAPEEQADIIP